MVKFTTHVSRHSIVSINFIYSITVGWTSHLLWWRLQISTLANERQFSCDKLCCNLLSRVSLLLHTRQKGLLTVVMVKMQDYPKLLIGAHRISFCLHLSSYGGFPLYRTPCTLISSQLTILGCILGYKREKIFLAKIKKVYRSHCNLSSCHSLHFR